MFAFPESTAAVQADENVSYWANSIEPISYPFLKKNLSTEVVIVGGGLACLSAAYCLSREGKRVVLLEDELAGYEESGRHTGQLTTVPKERYYSLERRYGKGHSRLIADSHNAAIEFIRNTVKSENIDCDFEMLHGYLFQHPDDKKEILIKELKASRNAGLDIAERNGIPGIKAVSEFCLQFNNQAQFHPIKYRNGLSEAIRSKGGQVFTHSDGFEITENGIKTGSGHQIFAKKIVLEASPEKKTCENGKSISLCSYLIGATVKKSSLQKGLWWDTSGYTARIAKYDNFYDLILCSKDDSIADIPGKAAFSEEIRYQQLENWLRDKFEIKDVIYKWTVNLKEPKNSIEYMDKYSPDEENIYVVSAYSKNGATRSIIAGIILSDHLLTT